LLIRAKRGEKNLLIRAKRGENFGFALSHGPPWAPLGPPLNDLSREALKIFFCLSARSAEKSFYLFARSAEKNFVSLSAMGPLGPPLGPPSTISPRGDQINLGLSHPAEEEREEDTCQSYASRIPTRTGKK